MFAFQVGMNLAESKNKVNQASLPTPPELWVDALMTGFLKDLLSLRYQIVKSRITAYDLSLIHI